LSLSFLPLCLIKEQTNTHTLTLYCAAAAVHTNEAWKAEFDLNCTKITNLKSNIDF